MNVRLRLAPSSTELFAAPSLGTVEAKLLPRIGDAYDDESGAYRVIKVMEDVDPEYGNSERGPIAYVVKVDRAPITSELPGDHQARATKMVDGLLDLGDCMRRGLSTPCRGVSVHQQRRCFPYGATGQAESPVQHPAPSTIP